MITEELKRNWKIYLAKGGDARVFGEESDVRRKMTDEEALEHFAKVWNEVLEREVRTAPRTTLQEAKELIGEKQAVYASSGYQYRQFSIHAVVFIAQLDHDADHIGKCLQLWPLGAHRDNTRLCMHFDTVAERERFDRIAKHLGFQAKELALRLAMDFLTKFPAEQYP